MRAVGSPTQSKPTVVGQSRQKLLNRLRRIEGQVRGVQRMVEEDRGCDKIIHQLAAVRSAAYSAGLLVLKEYAQECSAASSPDNSGSINDLIDVLLSFPG